MKDNIAKDKNRDIMSLYKFFIINKFVNEFSEKMNNIKKVGN